MSAGEEFELSLHQIGIQTLEKQRKQRKSYQKFEEIISTALDGSYFVLNFISMDPLFPNYEE